MYLDRFTPCGRYGQARGEGFLRRRTTLEPVETPRRYYTSDSQYLQAKAASTAQWSIWRDARHGSESLVIRTPFFELLDEELKLINTLVQDRDQEQFNQGVTKLQQRLMRSANADTRLQAARQDKNLPRSEVEEMLNELRRGPRALVTILEKLQVPASQEDGKRKLALLCHDRSASPTPQPPDQNPVADLSAVESKPEENTIAVQAEGAKLTLEPTIGETEKNTLGPEDIDIEPVDPLVHSDESKEEVSEEIRQEPDLEHDSTRLPSDIKVRDFAYE